MLISAVVTASFSLFYIRKFAGPPFIDKAMLKAMLKYSLPFIPASVAFWVTNLSGTFFINEYLGKHASGIYQIGAMIASGAMMITSAFQQAWSPFAFSIMNQPKASLIYSKVLLWYTAVMLAVCAGLSLFSHELLVLLTTPAYYGAENIIMILSYSYFFMGLIYIADLGAAIAKQTRPLGFILTVSAVSFPILTIALMPLWGKEGAATATCISQLIVPVYMFVRSQKLYYIPYQFGKVILLFVLSIIVVAVAKVFPNLVCSFWLRAALFIFFVAATLPLLGLSRKSKV
jgi:O-antigen/teichoic acid export membrane protein